MNEFTRILYVAHARLSIFRDLTRQAAVCACFYVCVRVHSVSMHLKIPGKYIISHTRRRLRMIHVRASHVRSSRRSDARRPASIVCKQALVWWCLRDCVCVCTFTNVCTLSHIAPMRGHVRRWWLCWACVVVGFGLLLPFSRRV